MTNERTLAHLERSACVTLRCAIIASQPRVTVHSKLAKTQWPSVAGSAGCAPAHTTHAANTRAAWGGRLLPRGGVASLQQACLAQSHGGDLLGDFIVLARGRQPTGYKARAGAIFFVKMAHAALEA